MASMEENFPRGGIQKKPTEGKTSNTKLERDNLFDDKNILTIMLSMTCQDNHSMLLFLLSQALCEGMLLLGCIKEVSDYELVVSLPNGLSGFVPVTQISDAYSKLLSKQVAQGELLEDLHSLVDLYSPGTLVRCIVTTIEKSADGRRSIKLSIDPKKVNKSLNASALASGMLLSGFVSSVEDHGYLIDIGVNGTNAFLPRQKAQNYIKTVKKGSDLKIGQNLNCVIVEVKNGGRVVLLSIDRSEVASSLATERQNWSLSNLLPGLVVKARVQKVAPLGIKLSFLSFFTGIVDFMHMDPEKSMSYSPDQVVRRVKACIISINPTTKVVRLTLRQAFLHPGGSPNQISNDRIGAVVEESTVKAFYKQFGAVFELDDGTLAFARLKHLSKTRKSFKPGAFKAGCKHKCRIIDYKHWLKCRVRACNPAGKKLILTLKKNLVQSKLPVLSNYEDAKPGLITHGFVVCAREFGCIVKFYNDVKGLVPKNELSSEPISCPDEVFHEGQVVKVMVLKCEPEQERLLLSFRLSNKPALDDRKECTPKKKQEVKYQIGEMVDVKILKKRDNGLEVSVLEDEGNVIASIPTVHLSDFVATCKLLWHCLQEGDVLPRVMCLSDNGERIILSRKSAVISAVQEEQVVRNFSEIQPGMLLTGYVRNVMPFGVFVEFPFGVTGLAPKVSMSDKFVTDTKDHFVVGQTVIAKVMSIDEEKQRVLLNLKVSECSSGDSAAESFALLNQYFKEMKEIRNLLRRRGESSMTQGLCELVPGKELQLVVQDVKEDGSALFSGGCVTGLTVTATRYHLGGQGFKTKALVLHVDALASKVYVSLREELLKRRRLTENSQHYAIVQHIAEEFAIMSLETGQLAAIPIASHFNDTFRFDSEKLKVGQTISATLKAVKENDHGLLLAVQGAAKKNVFVRVRNESETALEEVLAAVKHSLSLGDVVTGTVKSVKPTHVTVAIDDKLTGSIHASRILDEVPIGSFPTFTLKAGQKVTARVVGGRDVNTHRYLPITHPHFTRSIPELSIRPSEIEGEVTAVLSPKEDSATRKLELYSVGQTITCFVKKYNILKNWLEVEVAPDIRGRVPHLLLSLSTKVLKHPEKSFKNGQAISATVTGTDVTETNLYLSLTGIQSLEQGTITVGMVTKVTPHIGLTIALPGGKTGKVSIFHLSDTYMEDPLGDFKAGKIVRCYILSNENGKIQLSLRQSRLNPKSKSKVEDVEITCIKDVKKGQLVRGYVKSITSSGVFFGKPGEAPRLQVSVGFTWDEDMNAMDIPVLNQKEESSESEEEEDPHSKRKKQTKKEKELEKQKKEKELCKLEAALMDPSRQPQSADDFDRLVLSSPNSSILWLQYMAFHLQATEIEKARAVAERALKTISFREEQEKLNVWVALLNLENMYGTEETLMKVFERAVQYNEPLKVFQHLCDIYASSEKYKQAEELYHTMLKRFRQEKSVWLKYASFLLKQGQTEATHRLLERAVKALPTKEHVDVISRFAQLEFRFGDAEHAKALFESTLSSYPKRTDIWSIYIDIMIKHGSQKEVRDIFERVVHLSLAPKKMKFLFKRYLDYEKKFGTTESVLAVKRAALEYVETKSSLADI
uniref:Protein RRP5 homolog n=1 Tax=Melopsittacus undulatus TaxID=13146 RepID=A0A8V5FW66_MELUD